MKNKIQISIRCKIGESLKNGFSGVNFGKYSIIQLPTDNNLEFKTDLLLNFIDEWKEGQIGSNPEKEGEIILSWLSLILKQKVKVILGMLNNVQTHKSNKELVNFDPFINFPDDLVSLYNKFRSLPLDNLLERYLRACECYQEALLISTNNPSVSFFLLVVCIECLSANNQDFYQHLISKLTDNKISKEEINKIYEEFIKEYGIKKNFINFIISNYDSWKDTLSIDEFKKFLSSVYDMRSSFTHSGENLEKYIKLVDSTLKAKSFQTTIKEKKLEFPGLNYLSDIVRAVLIKFLEKQDISEKDNIPDLALKESLVNVEVNDSLSKKKGEFVFANEFKYRK